MRQQSIATLTLNPAIDLGYEVDRVAPTIKMRSHSERHSPGGGGVNVARVLDRLGSKSRCHYLAGGDTGSTFDAMIDQIGLDRACTPIAQATRISTALFERESGLEYRIAATGPNVARAEWRACLDGFMQDRSEWLVASGSLPAGVPVDCYAQLAQRAAQGAGRLVLDTSGEPLRRAFEIGGIFLAKPSMVEFEKLTGRSYDGAEQVGEKAQELVRDGRVRYLAVTLGDAGALLATAETVLIAPALAIEAKSAVGAGDSFVAGMVHALASGSPIEEAFKLGVAAGSAAVLTPGSDLAYAADIERLLTSVAVRTQ